MLNVDGWTDGRTNGRKLARLCLPAKAGATISKIAWMDFGYQSTKLLNILYKILLHYYNAGVY